MSGGKPACDITLWSYNKGAQRNMLVWVPHLTTASTAVVGNSQRVQGTGIQVMSPWVTCSPRRPSPVARGEATGMHNSVTEPPGQGHPQRHLWAPSNRSTFLSCVLQCKAKAALVGPRRGMQSHRVQPHVSESKVTRPVQRSMQGAVHPAHNLNQHNTPDHAPSACPPLSPGCIPSSEPCAIQACLSS